MRAAFLFLVFWLALFTPRCVAGADISEDEVFNARPGKIFRMWPLEGGVRPGYKGFRILYRSTSASGAPIAVSGAVMYPAEVGNGSGRPIVAWAHPTSGVVTACAPSVMPDLAGNVQGIDRFTAAGYVIVAPDYEGLGAPGNHPYLIGTSASRTVLDAVRAVRNLKSARAGDKFTVWGHSQGGHAALFTGLEAREYAPEITLLGVAAAAPATKLRELFELDKNTASGRSLTSMALYSWSQVYGLRLDEFVAHNTSKQFLTLAHDCILTIGDFIKESDDEQALAKVYLTTDPTSHPAVESILRANTPGLMPAGLPVFLSQGTADTTVHPEVTKAYAKELCAGGTLLTFHSIPNGSHMWAGRDSAYAAFEWMAMLFAGRTPANHC